MRHLFPSEVDQAAALLEQGIPVAFPTETVYGLGAPVSQAQAIRKIFQMKGRPSDNPLICHIESVSQLPLLAREIPPSALMLANHFWPGPLTVVLKKQPSVLSCVTGGLDTVAIRMPRHPIALELIRLVGEPLVAPSANRSGKPSSTTAQHVLHDFQNEAGAVIDGGKTEEGLESTVIFLAGSKPLILRPGCITQEMIADVLKCEVGIARGRELKASPGTRYRHYAPKACLRLIRPGDDILLSPQKRQFLIATQPAAGYHFLTASNLYALLRQADDEEVEEIIVVCTEESWNQAALRDRLLKAAGAADS